MSTGAISPAEFAEVTAAAVSDLERTRRNVAALGGAIHAAHSTASPALARAVQAQQSLYDSIDAEFGLLTSAEAGERMGSRATTARRNLATTARADGRLLALRRGNRRLYPGFQFDSGGARPVVLKLRALAVEHDWDESSLIEWLVAPTTYLGGNRPVDVIDDEDKLLEVARDAFGVSW